MIGVVSVVMRKSHVLSTSNIFAVFLYKIIHENKNGVVWSEEEESDSCILFVVALSAVVVSLELVNLSHIGIKRAVGHLFQTTEGERTLYWPICIVSMVKLGIILFCMTLSVWLTEPEYLAPAACVIVIALSITRVVVYFSLHQKTLLETSTMKLRETVCNAKNVVVRAATKRNFDPDECR